MSVFNNKTITNAGMQLLAKGMSGETITFKNIVLGSGTFTGDDLAATTQLVNLQHTLPITSVKRNGSSVSVTTTLTPQQIENDYNWSELGVMACGDDGQEILYLYGHTTQTSVISKSSLDEKIIQVTLLVSNVQNVNAIIDDSMVFLTLSELTRHNESEESHIDIRESIKVLVNDVTNLKGGLKTYIDFDSVGCTVKTPIVDLIKALKNNEELFANVSDNETTIYPNANGTLHVRRLRWARIELKFNYGNKEWFGYSDNGVFTGWEEVHSTSSKVDADTLDGKHANDFMPSVGGTITGDITITHEKYPSVWLKRGTKQGMCVVEGGNNSVSIQAYNTDNDDNVIQNTRRILSVRNSSNQSSVVNAVCLSDWNNGTQKQYLLYGEHNKGSFRQLSDTTITDADFSPTDVGANMYKIFNAMPNFSILMDRASSGSFYPNLYASLLAKAKSDLGITAFTNGDIIIKFEKSVAVSLPNKVTIRDNQSFKEYAFMYDRGGTTDYTSKMYQTFGEGLGGGGLINTTMLNETITVSSITNTTYGVVKNYSNTKGGMARLTYSKSNGTNAVVTKLKVTVDGVVKIVDSNPIHLYDYNSANSSTDSGKVLDIPFKSNFKIEVMGSGTSHTFNILYYINN